LEVELVDCTSVFCDAMIVASVEWRGYCT
jgi:hypothetical protein